MDTKGEWSERLRDITRLVTNLGASLEPDDDWMSVLFVEGYAPKGGNFDIDGGRAIEIDINVEYPSEEIGMMVFGLAGNFMENDASKNQLASTMKKLIIDCRGVGATFLSTVWAVEVDRRSAIPEHDSVLSNESDEEIRRRIKKEVAHIPRPTDHPDRQEKLMLISVYKGGEDDGTKICYADIKRSKDKPPQLGEWTLMDADMNYMGRFYEALDEGLRAVVEAA